MADQFPNRDAASLARLVGLPTLLAYEEGRGGPARVGQITDIHDGRGELKLWVELDPMWKPIPANKLPELYSELGFGHNEQFRTHWAVKPVDLFDVLQRAGYEVRGNQSELTISQFILRFLDDRPPTSAATIIDALQKDRRVIPKTVYGELSRLAASGQIQRVETGVYFLPPPDAVDTQPLDQVPAAYAFQAREGRVFGFPQTDPALDEGFVAEILPELLRKALTHRESIQRHGNSPGHVGQNAAEITDTIEAWENRAAPGVLLMRMRSLEAIISSYDTPEGRAELYPSAIAAMLDLKSSIEDFLALHPVITRIQANALALRIQTSAVPEIHISLVRLEEAASGISAVDDTAVAALHEGRVDVEQATTVIETSPDSEKVAAAVKARAEQTAHRVLSARNFMAALVRAAQNGIVEGTKEGIKVLGLAPSREGLPWPSPPLQELSLVLQYLWRRCDRLLTRERRSLAPRNATPMRALAIRRTRCRPPKSSTSRNS